MQFAVLGSLEVRASGTRITITAPKQRAVLVTLLLDGNNEVPIERLTRYVWDDQPPVAAHTTLQSYIYRLRQLLRPMSGVCLETSPASYALHLNPCETDIWSFKQGVDAARAQAAAGEPREATRSLRKALSLWRGDALAGVPGKLLQEEARFLEDERTAGHEYLFTLELALENHRAIVPELRRVVSRCHFNETLTAQLMLALYRSNRQAEALQTYTVLRRRLREQLGIDPSPELQELHKAILEQVKPTTIMLPSLVM